jgi:hypothetical protein
LLLPRYEIKQTTDQPSPRLEVRIDQTLKVSLWLFVVVGLTLTVWAHLNFDQPVGFWAVTAAPWATMVLCQLSLLILDRRQLRRAFAVPDLDHR